MHMLIHASKLSTLTRGDDIMNVSNNVKIQNETIAFKKDSQFKEIWRRLKKNKSAMIGLVIISIIIFLAIFASLITPYEVATSQNVRIKLQPPSADHWFGTDSYGRDIFARCIHGARVSLGIGLLATFVSLIVGGTLGSIAAFYGGTIENIIMRLIDVLVSVPTILLALAVVSALGSSIPNLIIAITLTRIASFVRIVRSAVLPVVSEEYIEAAYASGTRDFRIIRKHIIPNAMGPIMVQTTMSVAMIILQTASLSFLGLGINPPTPEWGAIISEGREFLRTAPHVMLFPGLFIIFSALSLNLFGDGLRDALDPRLKS